MRRRGGRPRDRRRQRPQRPGRHAVRDAGSGEQAGGGARTGGIEVTADSETTAGKTGFAPLAGATDDAAEAVAGADVIMITVPAMYHDASPTRWRPSGLGPDRALQHGVLGLAAADATARRQAPGRHLAESNIMPYICQPRGEAIHIGRYKRHFAVAAFPGERCAAVFDVLQRIYTQYDPAASVLDTNIAAAGNPPIHVTLTIPVERLLLRPLHGRQVLPGRDLAWRAARDGVRRRARGARSPPRV